MRVAVFYESGAVEIYGQDETTAAAARVVYARSSQPGSVNSGPLIQLWNPPTPGGAVPVNLVVSRIVASSAAAGRGSLGFQRRQLSNNGGGVLTPGVARFLNRNLAPANPIVLLQDAGIVGVIAGSNFDNLFWSELGGTFQIPLSEELQTVNFSGTITTLDFLLGGDIITLPPGWGVAVQHSQNGAGTQMSAYFIASPQ
jgi:hypothetical protein